MANEFVSLVNSAPQALEENELVNLGLIYRRFLVTKKCPLTNLPSITTNDTSVSLNRKGMYQFLFTIVVTAPAAGDVSFTLEENGTPIVGATVTETITTADTEFRTLSLNYVVLLDNENVLNYPTVNAKTVALRNSGAASTVESIVTTIVKEV